MRRFGGLEYKISRKPSALKASPKDGRLPVAEKDEEHRKPSVRCKAERIFLIAKRDFGRAKARCRGLAKNARSGFICSSPLRTS